MVGSLRLLLIFVLLSPAGASAQALHELEAAIGSTDPREVRAAIESAGVLGERRLVTPIAARIRRGLPRAELLLAIETLGMLGRPEAGPVLFDLLNHRVAEVRHRAVLAIAVCEPPGAGTALLAALGDPEPAVRRSAAAALASVRAEGAEEALRLAFEHGLDEAAEALGHLTSARQLATILRFSGTRPLSVARAMLLILLRRSDLAPADREQVITFLAELATPEARAILEEFIAGLPAQDRSPLRRSAESALTRIAP